MNVVTLLGRLTKDPEVRYITGANQTAVCNFTLAVDRIGEGADFITCVAFGKTAENINKYMSKGRLLAIRGHIQTGSYENKDGRKIYTTDVIVERAKFVDGKNQGEAQGEQQTAIPDGFEAIDDEDVPF